MSTFSDDTTDAVVGRQNRAYTEYNQDLTCRGFDTFQDVVIFHGPVVGRIADFTGEAREYQFKKYAKKLSYFPTRAVALLQPGRGYVVLPRFPDIVEIWNFCRDQLGLNDDQAIWFDHDLEADAPVSLAQSLIHDAGAKARLEGILANTSIRRFLIFRNNPDFTIWVEAMGFSVVRDSKEWCAEYGYKHILHPKPEEGAKSFVELRFKPEDRINAPRGYIATNTEELLRAAAMFRKNFPECEDVLIKPIYGSDGDGIEFHRADNEEAFASYSFEYGEVLLEEKLNLDKNVDGSDMSVVTHYFGPQLLGPSCDQLLGSATSVTAFNGNIFPSSVPRALRKECERMALAIMGVSKPTGPGGFDFLFQGGTPFVADVNSGRFNGGMYPKAFHKQFADHDSAYVSFKHVPRCTITELHAALKEANMDFIPMFRATEGAAAGRLGNYGVFPLVHLPGNFGSYIAVAPTRDEVMKLKNFFYGMAL